MEFEPEVQRILLVYGFRCIRCGAGQNLQIHEIEPKSKLGAAAMTEENQIVLCLDCHEWAHSVGTLVSGPVLEELRLKALERFHA